MMAKKTKAERAYKDMKSYVKDKTKLFNNCYDARGLTVRSRHMLEILEEMQRIMRNA